MNYGDVDLILVIEDNETDQEMTLYYTVDISLDTSPGEEDTDGFEDPGTDPGLGDDPDVPPLVIDTLDIFNEVGEIVYIEIEGGYPGEQGYRIDLGSDSIIPLPGGDITTQVADTFATVVYPDGSTYAYPVDAEHPNRFYFMMTQQGEGSITVSDATA